MIRRERATRCRACFGEEEATTAVDIFIVTVGKLAKALYDSGTASIFFNTEHHQNSLFTTEIFYGVVF